MPESQPTPAADLNIQPAGGSCQRPPHLKRAGSKVLPCKPQQSTCLSGTPMPQVSWGAEAADFVRLSAGAGARSAPVLLLSFVVAASNARQSALIAAAAHSAFAESLLCGRVGANACNLDGESCLQALHAPRRPGTPPDQPVHVLVPGNSHETHPGPPVYNGLVARRKQKGGHRGVHQEVHAKRQIKLTSAPRGHPLARLTLAG